MDQRFNKRGPGGPMAPKKTDQNTHSCNRTGCSGRIKNSQNTKIGGSDNAKLPNPSFRSPNGDEITRKSSGSSSITTTSAKKPSLDSKRNLPSQVKFDSSASRSSVQSASRSSGVGSFSRFKGDGLRNLKCNLISDVVPVRRKTLTRRTISEGESSSSRRERKTNTSSSTTVNASMGLCDRRNGKNGSSVRERAVGLSEIRDGERSPSDVGRGSLRSYASSGNGGNENRSDGLDFDFEEAGFTRFMGDGLLSGYNLGGIAEMLLALDRIEQNEELTHEDLLELETSFFLGGLNLHDRHRDMRLDIENMSYEELLALEEEMGTVSTALPEDALSKCLTRSVFQATPSKVQITGPHEDEDDTKCSICQEEYVTGDVIGKLVECRHGYHITCINKWLQLKNWCPFCKASAAPSQTSSL